MNADSATVCVHEAAHAVMRCLVGLPATRLSLSDNGGLCEGTGRVCDVRQMLPVLLAGMACEIGYGLHRCGVDWQNTTFDDADKAREILNRCPQLLVIIRDGEPVFESVEAAMSRHLMQAGELLFPYALEIESLGLLLEQAGEMSARRVAAFMRHHVRDHRDVHGS
jgi:hypothetical protein